MKREIITIKGLAGPSEAKKVSAALHDVWGVRLVEINATSGEAAVSYDEQAASLHDFEQAIIDEGYEVEGKS